MDASLEISASRQFPDWLAEQQLSLAFTTYEAGKLFLVGLQPDGRLSVFERSFSRCLGLHAEGERLWMSSLYQLWRFENVLDPGVEHEGHDRVYLPQVGNTTGDIDIHDIGIAANGRPLFVSTLFSCLGEWSDTHSFRPLWKPSFVSRLAAEDRCHLNGLAMQAGRPRYLTAVSQSDVADGWRDHRRDGGVLIDYDSGDIVLDGLSMPHSPRLYQGTLYLHDSGSGHFGKLSGGRFERICFCPGYLRGLAFHGDYALVGLSCLRDPAESKSKAFDGLELSERLEELGEPARCGIHVIDLRSGDQVHWLRIEGLVNELYDVVALPGVKRPMAIGFMSDEIRRIISLDTSAEP